MQYYNLLVSSTVYNRLEGFAVMVLTVHFEILTVRLTKVQNKILEMLWREHWESFTIKVS